MKTSKHSLQQAKLDPNSEEWEKIVAVYQPLVSGWLRRLGIVENDISDLSQDVLMALVNKLPTFEHNGRTGAFRSWLKAITVNHCRRYWHQRKSEVDIVDGVDVEFLLEQLADDRSDFSRRWNAEHDRKVLAGILELIGAEFDATTMLAFRRAAIDGQAAGEIAKDLNVNVGQVYKYKFRVMKRLQEAAELFIDAGGDLSNSLRPAAVIDLD